MANRQDSYVVSFKAHGTSQFEKQAQRAAKAINHSAKAGGELNKQLRFMRGGFGQVGHQIQDIAVQLQAGTNGLIVFGQQGSQIASLFGPQGAVIGAILAVGAAIGTALLPELFKTVDHSKEFEEAFKRIEDSMIDAGGATKDLSAELAQLARISEQALQNQLAREALNAKKATNAAVASMIERFADLDDTSFLSIKSGLTDLGDAINMMRDLNGVIQPPVDTTAYLGVVNRLGQKFGETGVEATLLGQKIVKAMAKIKFDPTTRNVEELQTVLNELNIPNDDMLTFVTDLNKDFTKLYNTANTFNDLMDAVSNSASPKFDPNISSPKTPKVDNSGERKLEEQEKFLAALRQEVEMYDATEAELTVNRAIQMGITGEKLEQVAIEAGNLELLKEAKAKELERQQIAERAKRELEQKLAAQQSFADNLSQQVALYGQSQAVLTITKAVEMGITGEKLAQIAIDAQQLEKLKEKTEAEREYQQLLKQGNQARLDALLTENEQIALRYEKELAMMQIAGASNDELMARKDQQRQEFADKQFADNELLVASMQTFEQAATTALTKVIKEGASLGDVMKSVGDIVVTSLINTFAQMATQYIASKLAMMLFDNTLKTTNLVKDKITATALASAYAPAAAAVSLATQGGNAIPAMAGMNSAFGLAQMLSLASFDGGGFTGAGARAAGMDGKGGFLAMLHPNETVIDHTKGQVARNFNNSIVVNVGAGDSGFSEPVSRRQIEASVYKGASKAYRRNR